MVTSRPWAAKAPTALAVMNGACGPCTCQSSTNFTLVWAAASGLHARRVAMMASEKREVLMSMSLPRVPELNRVLIIIR